MLTKHRQDNWGSYLIFQLACTFLLHEQASDAPRSFSFKFQFVLNSLVFLRCFNSSKALHLYTNIQSRKISTTSTREVSVYFTRYFFFLFLRLFDANKSLPLYTYIEVKKIQCYGKNQTKEKRKLNYPVIIIIVFVIIVDIIICLFSFCFKCSSVLLKLTTFKTVNIFNFNYVRKCVHRPNLTSFL